MKDKAAAAELFTVIGTEAEKIEKAMREELDGVTTGMDPLLREVLDYGLFSGGKRVRPLLVVLSARLCGKSCDEVYRLASAFEFLHAATLFHDDILDGSELRRGRQAVHVRFGKEEAILCGDFLLALAMTIVSRMAGHRGLQIFSSAAMGMVDGEFLQLRNAGQFHISEPDYYRTIMGKTGLLIAAACEVGALFGGGSDQQMQALRHYGEQLGLAFQMIDDVLDYQGAVNKTGKKVGGDLAEGKSTLPLILALAAADSEDRAVLLDILQDPVRRESSFSDVYALIDKAGGFAATQTYAAEAMQKAVDGLSVFDQSTCGDARIVLTLLAQYVVQREK